MISKILFVEFQVDRNIFLFYSEYSYNFLDFSSNYDVFVNMIIILLWTLNSLKHLFFFLFCKLFDYDAKSSIITPELK